MGYPKHWKGLAKSIFKLPSGWEGVRPGYERQMIATKTESARCTQCNFEE